MAIFSLESLPVVTAVELTKGYDACIIMLCSGLPVLPAEEEIIVAIPLSEDDEPRGGHNALPEENRGIDVVTQLIDGGARRDVAVQATWAPVKPFKRGRRPICSLLLLTKALGKS